MSAPLVTVRELAAHLSVAPATVYRLAGDGSIPSMRVGRAWRFDVAAVEAALATAKADPWRQSNQSLGRKRGPRTPRW